MITQQPAVLESDVAAERRVSTAGGQLKGGTTARLLFALEGSELRWLP
jgi:hypothetical protein